MTRRLLRATVTIETEYELYVDVPTYMTEDDIKSEIEALVHDGDTLPIDVTTTTDLDPADDTDGDTVTVLYDDGDDETMDESEWAEWRESLIDPEVERKKPGVGQRDIFTAEVES